MARVKKQLTTTLTPASAKVRASRLRRKEKLSPDEEQWLTSYEAKKQTARFPAAAPSSQRPVTGQVERKTINATVHATEAPKSSYQGATWVPVAPASVGVDGVEVKETPLVAETVDEAALQAADAKVGGLLALLVAAGLASAETLAKDGKLPIANDLIRDSLDEQTKNALLQHVAACGARVARKHNISTAWQYEDEATVALAAFGSAFLIFTARRASEAKDKPAAPVTLAPATEAAAAAAAARKTTAPKMATMEQTEFAETKVASPTASEILRHVIGGD